MSEEPDDTEAVETESYEKRAKKQKKGEIRDWVRAFIIAFFIFALLRLIVFDVNEVSGTSMEPAFYRHDKVIVEKLTTRFGTIERGDIVVFKKPGGGKRLIKRVIAVPGDKVTGNRGDLYVNDRRLEEPYVLPDNTSNFNTIYIYKGVLYVDGRAVENEAFDAGKVYAQDDPASENTVPEGCYLVLGDNRMVSMDSTNWGFLPDHQIVGRVWIKFRLFPPAFGSF